MESHRSEPESAEFFGREAALLQLQSAFDRSLVAEGERLAVVGPIGIGKTRLLAEFGKSCAAKGASVVVTTSDADADRPYEIWRQVIRRLMELGHNVTPEFPRVYSDVLLQVVATSSVPNPSSSVLPNLPTEQVRYRLYDAVRLFLRKASASKPVVIVMDDLQSADGPSTRLLRHLFGFAGDRRLMFVAGIDSDDASKANPEALALLDKAISPRNRIVLGPLEKQWMPKTVGFRTGTAGGLQGESLFEITKGHPLHTALILKCIAASGGNDAPGESKVDLASATFSLATPQLAALQLVRRLPEEPRRTLAEIALVASRFTSHEIQPLIQRPLASVQDVLGLSHLLGLVETHGEDLYQFGHALIRQVLIDILDLSDRMRLLHDAAKTVRLRNGSSRIWQAAQWYYSTRETASKEGATACLEASVACRTCFAPELSSRYLKYAEELAAREDIGLEERILTDLVMAGAEAGDLSAASNAAERVLAIMRRDGRPQSEQSAAMARFAQLFHDSGAEEKVWRRFGEMALEADGQVDPLIQARIKLLEHGQMQKLSDAPIQAGRWLGLDPDAIKVARDRGTEDDYCRTLLVYDWLSVDDVESLLKRAEKWKSAQNRARVLSVAAETFMYRHGEFERACSLLEDQLHMHEASGSLVEQAKSLVRLTMAQLAAGMLEEALETRTRAEEMVGRLGPGYLIYEHAGTTRGGDLYPAISMESNFAWYVEGDWKAVAEHWVRAIGLEEAGGSPVHIVEAAMAAQAFARLDRFDDARVYLRELTPVLQKLRPRDWAFNGAVGRAIHAIWDMRDVEFAKDYRSFALKMLEAGVSDWTNTSLELTVARTAALLGSKEESYAYFDKARAKLRPKADDPRRAIIDYDQAVTRRLLGDIEGADALLSSALATFQKRGMKGWAQRVLTEKPQSIQAKR